MNALSRNRGGKPLSRSLLLRDIWFQDEDQPGLCAPTCGTHPVLQAVDREMSVSTPRLLAWLLVAALVAASCSSGDDAATSTSQLSPSATRIGTSAPNPSVAQSGFPTTTTIGDSIVVPSYLVYGWHGVVRVNGDASERLVSEPVGWATEDGAGGVVFWSVAEQPGWVWLSADENRPRAINIPNDGYLTDRFVFAYRGRPSALVSRGFDRMTDCEPNDFVQELTIVDLETGEERFLMCHDEGPDGGATFTSYGDGIFLAVPWGAAGAGATNSYLWFYDLSGERVSLEHNPFAESCAPCQLSAALSPDGSLLAYALWPTAYWQQPDPPDGDYTRAYREWFAQQRDIPTELVVMDLTSGAEVFRTEVAADGRLTNFDGRFVTVTVEGDSFFHPSPAARRLLIDLATGEQFEAPPAVSEAEGFWTAVLASIDTGTTGYDDAQQVANELAREHNLATGVVWSDGFLTLNPGYWAVFTGYFDTQIEAADQCETIDAACYPRYVATADTIDPELGRSMLTLEPDGLGLVEFGDPEHEVLALFERLLGSRPSDGGDEAGWVEYVGWADFGLYLGFSRAAHEEYDIPRFVGWHGSVALNLTTSSGVGVGSTIADLRAIYGDDLVIPTDPDVCSGLTIRLLGPDSGIVAEIHQDIGVVNGLGAGLHVGC